MNRLILHSELYSLASIERACLAYKDYANIRICQNGLKIELSFENCKYDSELTVKEFENYLIDVENMKKCY